MNKTFITHAITKTACVLVAALSTLSITPSALAFDSIDKPVEMVKAGTDPTQLDKDALKGKIKRTLGLTVIDVEATPVPGIAMLITNQGVYYASYSGDYFIQGKVYSLGATVTDLSEKSLAKIRLEGVERFKDDMIVYKAKDEKHVVTVFTDITCGYCRKMHAEMDEYNAKGITFKYLAYPRSGISDRLGNPTQGFKDLRSVWCNEDPAEALTKAKTGGKVAYRICDKPIEAEFNFGRQIGVSGTPAIILENGMMLPGYQPPAQLEEILKNI
ncbi:bifunctional protein-disulfide isomerase/oxidoreductase DsbC [Litorilituus lipolyticus]|uniref:Thiol:disulfide interchange protein n=1 Tax=Litorilituus lipolyticus TaxID=2491017 RepID=A0A502KYP1_9GAMM|nr:bifunctional protein-disulfide isomerase/oxidoreductase DsbC [Litorilituus lipolyticus]TPH16596.1 bifunctional protein-disulfide isomerase/oxidoreductase DsbC [Litorilituus lipolyticus]